MKSAAKVARLSEGIVPSVAVAYTPQTSACFPLKTLRQETMRRFQAVIFDMDGLLLDTERIGLDSFVETCKHFGIGLQMDVFERCLGTNHILFREVLREGLQGRVDALQFEQVWDIKYEAATSSQPIPVKDGARELLLHLTWLPVPAAVATSTRSAQAAQKLRDAGILGRFDVVVGGDQVFNGKPHPDIYLKAAALLGVRPEGCLALEDSENGVQAALSAGMTVIQIPDLVQPSADVRSLGHIILGSLRDVMNYLIGSDITAKTPRDGGTS